MERYKHFLQQMDPDEFEVKMARALCMSQGWDGLEVTHSSRDNGVDAVACEGATRIGMQMKRYGSGNKVGGPAIQQYAGVMIEYDFDMFIIVCSSDFTPQARKKASKLGIGLIDGNQIAQLVSKLDGGNQECGVGETHERRPYSEWDEADPELIEESDSTFWQDIFDFLNDVVYRVSILIY